MNKNKKLLNDFTKYCSAHPELRFWQALRNWSGASNIIYNVNKENCIWDFDTFYWTDKSQANADEIDKL